MFWFPVIAAGAAAAILGKRLARYFNGQLAHSAVHDPAGVRTRVRFELDPGATRQLLGAVAAAITPIVEPAEPLEVSAAAVRGGEVDILRLAPCAPGTYTLTLTRAWTGAQLNAVAVEVLERLHDVLARVPVRGLAWFARQDRGFAAGYPYPFDP